MRCFSLPFRLSRGRSERWRSVFALEVGACVSARFGRRVSRIQHSSALGQLDDSSVRAFVLRGSPCLGVSREQNKSRRIALEGLRRGRRFSISRNVSAPGFEQRMVGREKTLAQRIIYASCLPWRSARGACSRVCVFLRALVFSTTLG